MRVIISNCLLGVPCRFDGSAKPSREVRELAQKTEVCAICPEVTAGLSTPRPPAERLGDAILLKDGTDVTRPFVAGARKELERAQRFGARIAILKAKSPSCGVSKIYDGTHTGTLVFGDGILTQLLKEEGICVVTEETLAAIKPSVEHPVAIILGTGLAHLARLVTPVRRIAYADIDGFPVGATAQAGQVFEATIGTIDEVPVVVYPGRLHLYQGYTASEVVSLVRHAHKLGCRDIIFACATAGIAGNAHPGLGIISDHINLTGINPLADPHTLRDLPTAFISMREAYSPYLCSLTRGIADDLGIELQTGVLAQTLGPSFETAAEIEALRRSGVSYVGMSVACEVIMARALGMHVLGLTLVAHQAGAPEISHESIRKAAEARSEDFERLVCGVLRML